ncbi:MAG TPA: cytochrome c, partial [Verrucomicrobiaceae bacterium]
MADPVEYPLVAGFDRFHAPEDDEARIAEGGLLLLGELKCTSCHAAPEVWQEKIPARAKLSLAGVGSRLSADDIWLFVRSPQHRKKGTTMPGLFGGEERDDAALEAITQFLASLKETVKKYPAGDVERGRRLYHTIGCVACHEPAKIEDYRPAEAPPDVAVEKPGLPSVPVLFADRYDRNALVKFLLDPLKARHDGRMPRTEMTEQEAADVAAYLQINREPLDAKERAMLKIKSPGVEQGKSAFVSLNCIACHEIPTAKGEKLAGAAKQVPSLASLQPERGCLSATKKAGVPDYGLSDFQKRALKLALAKIKAEARPPMQTAMERCDAFFTRMNCYACHEFRGKGGLEEPRAQYFTVNDPTVHSMGEIGRLPPKLDVAGRKLTTGWLEKLLWGGGGGVRSYMTARMPKFGEGNAAPIVAWLEEACAREKPVTIDTSGLAKHHRAELGRVLMGTGTGGLGCVSCHGLKDRKALGVAMINLTNTVQRIQPEYFKELLLNPQATQVGTLMPPLFMGRKKADQEIEEIWTYLKEIDQSRLPEGLLQTGDYELKPEKEKRPIIFRTFLVGAGMEAIAVGFPQQVHAAFDALEVRWAEVWKGKFVDAMTTWEERAMTPAKPLTDKPRALPAHMPLAQLASDAD